MRSFDFEIMRMISDQTTLHSVQLPLFIDFYRLVSEIDINLRLLSIIGLSIDYAWTEFEVAPTSYINDHESFNIITIKIRG